MAAAAIRRAALSGPPMRAFIETVSLPRRRIARLKFGCIVSRHDANRSLFGRFCNRGGGERDRSNRPGPDLRVRPDVPETASRKLGHRRDRWDGGGSTGPYLCRPATELATRQ